MKEKKKNKILIVIPAYNEEKNILNTYKTIENYNKKYGVDYDVIVINDGSSDKTKEVLEKNDIPHINLITNLGIGGAVQTGYRYAYYHNYDIAVQFDGDGQHDISYVKDIVNPIINNECNMCIGSRFLNRKTSEFRSSMARRIGIKIISIFIKIKTGKKIGDTTSGFRAIDKKIINKFAFVYPLEYPEPISTTMLLQEKYVVKEVPANMMERTNGKSSIRAWKSAYYMINVIMTILLMKKGDR